MVLFTDPVGQPVLIPANDVKRAIVAPSVHNDVFDVREILGQHALNGALQRGGAVINHGHDTDLKTSSAAFPRSTSSSLYHLLALSVNMFIALLSWVFITTGPIIMNTMRKPL